MEESDWKEVLQDRLGLIFDDDGDGDDTIEEGRGRTKNYDKPAD